MLSVNIIGAGAVGQTLGHLLVKHGAARIQAVVNQSDNSGKRAIQFIGQGQCYLSVKDLPSADVVLITVPDQRIATLATELVTNSYLQPGTIVLHCSGTLTSNCLEILHARQCTVASLHPMFSFKEPKWSVSHFANTPCAIEGDVQALEVITTLFNAIGAMVYQIAPEKKALYHAAAVFAANYPITLLQQAHACFLDAGLSAQQTKCILDKLLYSVLENVKQVSEPKLALTGPIQRADVATLERHLQALTNPAIRDLYQVLANATLAITDLNSELQQQIRDKLAALVILIQNSRF